MIFTLLLGVPLSLAGQILSRLRDDIDRERLITEESIKQKLQETQLLLQDGALDETEYDQMETALIERLKAVRTSREQGGL